MGGGSRADVSKSSIRNSYETTRLLHHFGANNSFRCNIYGVPTSVASKGLTGKLNSLDATLTKKQGATNCS